MASATKVRDQWPKIPRPCRGNLRGCPRRARQQRTYKSLLLRLVLQPAQCYRQVVEM